MQDKQIIGELLTTFLSSRDVLGSLQNSSRKLVILRRGHALSLPAAIRVRTRRDVFISDFLQKGDSLIKGWALKAKTREPSLISGVIA